MATSSLKKSFVISSKKEVDTFAKMFVESIKTPSNTLNDVHVKTLSKNDLRKLIDGSRK